MKSFQMTTKLFMGPGSVGALGDMHIERLLVVSDPFFAQNGTAQAIAAAAGAKKTQIFDQVAPDPSVTLAAQGAAVVQAFRPDAVVALGGGSAMDCGKAMVYFSGLSPQFIAIPTTSGSGSEVTDFAILTHDGIKHPLVDERLRPQAAILDSDLLQQLPQSLVADGGFDLMSHALEALGATGASQVSDALASDAFCRALHLLPRSYSGDTSVRMELHTAATMAGMAFSAAGLGICHALAHALGGEFHIPHGRLNAILLPGVVEANAPAAGEKYAALARRAGISSGVDAVAIRGLKNALCRLRRNLQLPDSLVQAGIPRDALEQKLPELTRAALEDPCCSTNPVPVTLELLEKVLREVLGRG